MPASRRVAPSQERELKSHLGGDDGEDAVVAPSQERELKSQRLRQGCPTSLVAPSQERELKYRGAHALGDGLMSLLHRSVS